MDKYSAYVPNVHFEKIPIKNLVSNQDYQRNLSIAHVQKAAEEFDLCQINPVKVSRRNGINYVFNGQHTIEIVALVSGSRDTPVWCMIYDDLSYQHEADIFANQMRHVKSLAPYEMFVANIEAGNTDQLMIRDLVESLGLRISPKKEHCTIGAISTVEAIYQKYGFHLLRRVLLLIIAAWEGDTNSFSANILNAVTKLCVVYRDSLIDSIFGERLGTLSPKQVTRMARERRPGCMGYAEVMVLEYNGKKKTNGSRLDINKLYAREHTLWAEDDMETSLFSAVESDASPAELWSPNPIIDNGNLDETG